MAFSQAVTEAYKEIEEISNLRQAGGQRGITIGLKGLDRIIAAGVRPQDFMVIGARPGQGKTSLLLTIITTLGKAGKSVVFFSIEMGRIEVMIRLLCMLGEVEITRVNTGFMNREDWVRIGRAAAEMSQWKVWIDDSTGIQVTDLRPRIRRTRVIPDVICGDYLQLLEPPKHLLRATDNEKIAYSSKHIKFLCKSQSIPQIWACQLSRKLREKERRAATALRLASKWSNRARLRHSRANSQARTLCANR